jgi:hypothetical protein
MAYSIEPRKVAGVIIETNQALEGKGFNHGEVVVGLSELLGRIIVDAAQNNIQMQELVKVVNSHIAKTIEIGSHARDKNIIKRV